MCVTGVEVVHTSLAGRVYLPTGEVKYFGPYKYQSYLQANH